MKILVCISHVPDTTSRISFVPNSTELETKDLKFVINSYDELTITRAIELKQQIGKATITIAHVGGKETEVTIRKALAMGADNAVRIDAQPADAYFVAQQLASVAEREAYDIILVGKESADYNGGQVGEMLAEFLDIPSVSGVSEFVLDDNKGIFTREIDGGYETLTAATPFVVIAQKGFVKEIRVPNMRGIMQAKRKRLDVVEPTQDTAITTIVAASEATSRTTCTILQAGETTELARLLREEAKVI